MGCFDPWALGGVLQKFGTSDVDPIWNEAAFPFPCRFTTLNIYFMLRRKQYFYYINFCMPTFMLGLISFVAFFMPLASLDNRMNLTVVILLSIIAFRFSMVRTQLGKNAGGRVGEARLFNRI